MLNRRSNFMKKKVLATLAAALAVTSVSFASPLTNYDNGKVAIDLSRSISPKIEYSGGNDDTKSRFAGGLTYGLGNKFAIQYKYADNKTKNYSLETSISTYYLKISTYQQYAAHEVNVLYQINPNVSAFAGWTKAIAKNNLSLDYGPSSSNITYSEKNSVKDSKNGLQMGIIGQTKLADHLTGWASVGAGTKLMSYEVGLGYDIAKNTEFNVFYRYNKYKEFNFGAEDLDVKTKGFGAGVTLKF